MDGAELFRKLGFGAKFNFSRFKKDAEKLNLVKNKQHDNNSSTVSTAEVVQDDKLLENVCNPSSKKRKEREEESGEEEEEEVTLLGAIKSTGNDEDVFNGTSSKKKKQKQKKKSVTELNAEIRQEKVNHYRNKHKIHVYGTDIPEPVETFEDLRSNYGVSQAIISNIKSSGFEKPTPIQMQAIPGMLHRREILACAPTGSGKTLGFILPILHQLKGPQNKGFRALVLSPTRELAMQTYRELVKISEGVGFRIHVIEKVGKAAKKFGPKSSQKFDILVTTPNRLVYMLNQDTPLISLSNVEWLVVDESDKLFEEGKTGFRDQLAAIYRACDGKNVRRAMFSATFAYHVEEWCKLNLDNVIQVYVGERNSANEKVEQELTFVGSESGKLLAVRNLVKKGIQPPILIFVQSKERAKELFHELVYDGINVDVIHADRTQLQRDNIIKQFRAGNIWVLICTELMGRGIDFKGINLVINFDFPNSAVSYIHRIGRTGRAGRRGKAITFFTEDDVTNLRSIANVMRTAGCEVPDYMLKLKKLDKQKRRKMAKSAVKRKTIRTFPKKDIQKAHQRRLQQGKGKPKAKHKTTDKK